MNFDDKKIVATAQLFKLPPGAAGLPSDLTGLPIFATGNRGNHEHVVFEAHDATKHVSVRFEGRRMGVEEETLWMAVIRLAEGLPVGAEISVTVAEMLREIGLVDAGENRKVLEERLDRLGTSTIFVKARYKKFAMTTKFISYRWLSDQLFISLDPDSASLFSRGRLAYQDWAFRLSLSSFEKKLLTVISGHSKTISHHFSIDEMITKTGWTAGKPEFRRSIKKACENFAVTKAVHEISFSKSAWCGGGEYLSFRRQ